MTKRQSLTHPIRKPLRAMTAAELRDWFSAQQAELEQFCSFAQSYLKRREGNDRHTQTDEVYARFLSKAADLIAGLEELRQVITEADDQAQAIERERE